MKKILFVFAATLMLLGALSTPSLSAADGGPISPNPDCKAGQVCKP